MTMSEPLVLRQARIFTLGAEPALDLTIAHGRVRAPGVRDALPVDLGGRTVLPGLVNALDVLDLSVFPPLGEPPFASLYDWTLLAGERPTEALIASLEASAAAGARGLKVWKDLGLQVVDGDGRRVLPDDERLTEAFVAAGELGLPILVHTADPVAFFEPLDRHNERLEELAEMPAWWFGGPEHPTFDRLMAALESMVASAPGTTFIGAHVGCAAEDLDWVRRMMDEHGNFHVDLGGRLGELGRQPRRFAALVADHPDRVLFGTDSFPPEPEVFRAYYQFLESADEPNHFATIERWTTRAASDAHMAAPHLQAFLGLAASCVSEAPSIEAAEVAGMERVL